MYLNIYFVILFIVRVPTFLLLPWVYQLSVIVCVWLVCVV